jgi:hypothetical protein
VSILPRQQSKQPVVILIVFGIVMAYLGYEMMEFRRAGKNTHGVEVTVRPSELKLKRGESAELTAAMIGSENSDLVWRVAEANGGTVVSVSVSEAKYTAPAQSGTFHVMVTSKADETKSATVTVVVQ